MRSPLIRPNVFGPLVIVITGFHCTRKELPTQHPLPHSPTHPPSWALGITADGETGQCFVLQIIKGREGKYVRTPIVLQ